MPACCGAECAGQLRFAGPPSGGVLDEQRRVQTDDARAAEEGRDDRVDLVVGAHAFQRDQRAGWVEHGDAGAGAVTPGKVDADDHRVDRLSGRGV